ncbi:MAG: hypothetical protein IIB90_12590 [Gemmatimonadetes bacterium]|nr:hypothetical protein [Gemmatimonadota bacterium]
MSDQPSNSSPRWAIISLLILVELAALTYLSRISQPSTTILFASYAPAFAAYVALLAIARRGDTPLWLWFATALLLRIPWIIAGASLSDDVWRYIHDGRAQLAGISPFLYPPSAPEAAAYAGPEVALINNPDLTTIYPPFAQLAFRIAASLGATLLSWKLVLLVFDLGIGAALIPLLRRKKLPLALVAAYLLHPLPIIEFAGNGHVDAIAICTLMIALAFAEGRVVMSGAAFAASVASKYLALPLVPFFIRNLATGRRLVFLGAAAAAGILFYLPFTDPLPLGSLGTFARTFEFNGPVAGVLSTWITPEGARWFMGGSLLLLLGWLWWRKVEVADVAFLWIAGVLLLSPIVHPWYVTWLVPFLAWRRDMWVLVWTGTVIAAYAVLPDWWSSGIWDLPGWALLLEYLPVYILLAAAAISYLRRRPDRGHSVRVGSGRDSSVRA